MYINSQARRTWKRRFDFVQAEKAKKPDAPVEKPDEHSAQVSSSAQAAHVSDRPSSAPPTCESRDLRTTSDASTVPVESLPPVPRTWDQALRDDLARTALAAPELSEYDVAILVQQQYQRQEQTRMELGQPEAFPDEVHLALDIYIASLASNE